MIFSNFYKYYVATVRRQNNIGREDGVCNLPSYFPLFSSNQLQQVLNTLHTGTLTTITPLRTIITSCHCVYKGVNALGLSPTLITLKNYIAFLIL